MAQGKKTIVVYADWDEIFSDLTNEEAGILIKHFFEYINDRNPVLEDRFLSKAFQPIKSQLKRDLEKWEQTIEGRSAAGRASAEARRIAKEKTTKTTNVEIVQQKEQPCTNPTDNVNVSVNDNDILLKKETKNIIKEIKVDYPLPFTEEFRRHWILWLEFKRDQFKFTYKSQDTLNTTLWDLVKKSKDNEAAAIQIIKNSIDAGYKGLFALKNNPENGIQQPATTKQPYKFSAQRIIDRHQQAKTGDTSGELYEDTSFTDVTGS